MDPKISALTSAFQRVTRVYPGIFIAANMRHPGARRFVALFKARNRRTRVLMRRAARAKVDAMFRANWIPDAPLDLGGGKVL